MAQEALEILREVLGPEDKNTATSAHSLASLYRDLGEYAKAEPVARQSLRLYQKLADQTLTWLPEARAMAFMEQSQAAPRFHPLLSVLRKLPGAAPAGAYEAVWETRGLVSRMLAERRQGWADSPDAARLVAQLQDTCQQLAQLTLAAVKPEQRAARTKRLGELNEEKERLGGRTGQGECGVSAVADDSPCEDRRPGGPAAQGDGRRGPGACQDVGQPHEGPLGV